MGKLMEERLEEFRELKKKAALGGGPEKIEKQHEKGKLTARERLDRLLDPGSFVELGSLVGHLDGTPGDGIVAGHGTIDGRAVCIYSQDATVLGGSIGGQHGNKMYRTVDRALNARVPLIGLHDSPGARMPRLSAEGGIRPGEAALASGAIIAEKHGGSVFFPNTQASGVIPQIAAVLGSCAGISVYSPALMDFIFMVDGISHMFITGPRVVKSVMGEDISMEDLGGAEIHTQVSGVCDLRTKTEDECLAEIRKLIGFLPLSCDEAPPVVETGDAPDRLVPELEDIIPEDADIPYDVHQLITGIVDNGDFFEIKPEYAGEIVVGFGRLGGHTIGIVANQPMIFGGAMTCESSWKQARFIRFCDCFNIPLVIFVDTAAYAPGSEQEHGGIIRHGAKCLYALCEATVPRVEVVTRKAYGGGNLGMGVMPGLATDLVLAWPVVEAGVMGAKESVMLFYGQEIFKAENPEQFLAEKIKEYRDTVANPLRTISAGPAFEDIIEPRETRKRLYDALELLKGKKVFRQPKKHGNIPL
ncbi:MAG: acyl-CoA carboxylase subunit beta [Dehalococcoidia bacterium]